MQVKLTCRCFIRTIIYTGRPLRVKKTPFIMDWEENKQDQSKSGNVRVRQALTTI